ncbi:MAG: hypothetical protein NT040_03710 [Bacteroidetes bacterium]|nr:hypothetical protein [Bacteroidota bacterium]
MKKNNKHAREMECDSNSDNLHNSIEYIKRLELQRIVLNKIVNSDLNQVAAVTEVDPDSTESK